MNKFTVAPLGYGWDGWYFEDGYFCSPNGDRLTQLAVSATIMFRQTESVRDLMYWRPSRLCNDVVMHSYLDSPQPSMIRKVEVPLIVEGLEYRELRPAV